jgi:Domain of unknown function (DUF202)
MTGLQSERTGLAWRRTTLTGAALVLLAVSRTLTSGGRPLAIAATSVITLIWLATLGVAHRRIRALTAGPADPTTATRAPATLALMVVAIAVAGAVLVV